MSGDISLFSLVKKSAECRLFSFGNTLKTPEKTLALQGCSFHYLRLVIDLVYG